MFRPASTRLSNRVPARSIHARGAVCFAKRHFLGLAASAAAFSFLFLKMWQLFSYFGNKNGNNRNLFGKLIILVLFVLFTVSGADDPTDEADVIGVRIDTSEAVVGFG